MAIQHLLLFISFSFLQLSVYAQEPHSFKLEDAVVVSEKWKNDKGQKILTDYVREQSTIEGSDTVIYREKYTVGKQWRLTRYILTDGKPELSGWQQDFDAEGMLTLEQLCEGKRRCQVSRRFSYYPGKQLMSVANYYEDALDGHHYVFYNNGQLRQHIFFDKGRMQEVMAYYAEDGTPLDTGTLCDGNGYVNIFAMNGSLFKIKHYKNGKVTKVKKL
jgi:antitoxin component YwqK of YwqJK toxin-antitoxin module